jgi:hypothetical protein
MAMTFLKSPVASNVTAAYQLIMWLADSHGLVSVDDCIEHIQSTEKTLCELSLEYMRRHFIEQTDLRIVEKIVLALLSAFQSNHCERASVLLFHFAGIQAYSSVFQTALLQSQFLNISGDVASDLLQLLLVLMRLDAKLLNHPSVPSYLASVLKFGDDKAFITVCLLLEKNGTDRDWLGRIEEVGILGLICDRIGNSDEGHIVNYAAKALVRFVSLGFFDAFRNAVTPLTRQMIALGVEAAPCLVALSRIVSYQQIIPDVIATGIADYLSPFHGLPQLLDAVQFLQRKIANAKTTTDHQ